MKIRTTRYIIREGILNTYRNKLMSLASVSIVAASLIVFGVFFLIIVNVSNNIKGLGEQSEIAVFCDPKIDDAQVKQVEYAIKGTQGVEKYTVVSKKEAFEKVKKMLDDKNNLLEGMDESFLPVSFVVKLKDSKDSENIVKLFEKLTGVEKVNYPKQTIDLITKTSYWVNLISIFLLIILLIVSLLIISNTIKLTVFARRREINIMKYIGATDWFIRWPFIIEGIMIGLIGAVAAFILVSYGYNAIEAKFNNDLLNVNLDFIRIVKLRDVGTQIMIIYSLIGAIVGAVGSVISIRKYLIV